MIEEAFTSVSDYQDSAGLHSRALLSIFLFTLFYGGSFMVFMVMAVGWCKGRDLIKSSSISIVGHDRIEEEQGRRGKPSGLALCIPTNLLLIELISWLLPR